MHGTVLVVIITAVVFDYALSRRQPVSANNVNKVPSGRPGIAERVTPRPATAQPAAVLCFLACALVVGYGLYLITAR
jgi:hypothetical protein